MQRYSDMAPQLGGRFKELSFEIIKRNLKFITAILLILTIILIIGIIIVAKARNEFAEQLENQKKRVCLTPACIKKASSVLHNMNPSIDPCDDFYKFSCGGFINKTFIPDDQSSVTSFTSVRNLVYQQIRNTLEEPLKPDEPKPFVLTKKFYNSCVNTSAIEADGLTTIKTILDNLGGWPLLENSSWYGAKFDWKQLMYTLRNIGYSANYFVNIRVIPDLKNSSQRVISIDQASLELPREILLKGFEHRLVHIYYNYMVDVAQLFGANTTTAAEELEEILDLQTALANISLPPEERLNETLLYNPMTIAKLRMVYPNTDWKQYIKYLLDIPDFKISDDETVAVRVPQYLHDLENLLNKTSERTQANYIMWRVVSSSIDYLTKGLRDRKLKHTKALTGVKQPLQRWRLCIFHTLSKFWKPLRALYDRKHFSQKSKVVATEMMSNIHSEFTKILQNTEWMDEDSKKAALEKAASWTIHAKPLEIEVENLTGFYSRLNFDSDNYLQVALAVSLFNNNEYFRSLRRPVEKKERSRDISMEYRIYVPGGIFQEVFFDSDQPHYMNYGAIGSLMGHSVTHGFDNMGRQFDKDDDLVNWWTNYTQKAFDELAQCFIEQYGNYTIVELSLNLNGKNTRDENIADNGGVKTAYLAYDGWVHRNGPEPQLPGLNYTAQQMFWISAANIYCSKYRKEQLNLIIIVSRSSPEYYKVIGSLSNSEYFARDFGCSLGSRMNPKSKCKIW